MVRCVLLMALIACVGLLALPAEAVDLEQRAYGGGDGWECVTFGYTCRTCNPLTPSGSYRCDMPWVQCRCEHIGIPGLDFCTPMPKSLNCGARIFYSDNNCMVSVSGDVCPLKDHCFGTGNCPN